MPPQLTIALWQPFASLLFTRPRTKVHETRSWPAPARIIGQRLSIHAAKRPMRAKDFTPELERVCEFSLGPLSFGAILGDLIVTGARQIESKAQVRAWLESGEITEADVAAGDWAPGRWIWRTDEVRELADPIPYVGRQGLFYGPGLDASLFLPPDRSPA